MAGRVRAAGRGGWRVRAGRHARQPVGARRGAACARRRGSRSADRPRPLEGRLQRRGALLDRVRGRGDGRRRASASPPTPSGRLRGDALRDGARRAGDGVFAVVATGGDDQLRHRRRHRLDRRRRAERGVWLHIDGAYGVAALCAPSVAAGFAGVERADSFIVDPHKWLFAPFDAARCSTATRGWPAPRTRSRPSTSTSSTDAADWNPSDYAMPPDPPGPRAAVLVLARDARHGGLPDGDRAARSRLARRIADEITARDGRRLRARAGAVGGGVPPDGWTPAAVRRLVGPAAARSSSRS